MPVERVSYWHVELDSYDILLAENLPAESYRAMANRAFFAGSDVVTLRGRPDAPAEATEAAHRPFVDGGPVVEAIRARVAAQAARLGWTERREEIAIRLVVNGRLHEGVCQDGSVRFVFPAAARDVRLRTDTFAPADAGGAWDGRTP